MRLLSRGIVLRLLPRAAGFQAEPHRGAAVRLIRGIGGAIFRNGLKVMARSLSRRLSKIRSALCCRIAESAEQLFAFLMPFLRVLRRERLRRSTPARIYYPPTDLPTSLPTVGTFRARRSSLVAETAEGAPVFFDNAVQIPTTAGKIVVTREIQAMDLDVNRANPTREPKELHDAL